MTTSNLTVIAALAGVGLVCISTLAIFQPESGLVIAVVSGIIIQIIASVIQTTKIEQVHIATNSMKDDLVKATGTLEFAKGLKEGQENPESKKSPQNK